MESLTSGMARDKKYQLEQWNHCLYLETECRHLLLSQTMETICQRFCESIQINTSTQDQSERTGAHAQTSISEAHTPSSSYPRDKHTTQTQCTQSLTVYSASSALPILQCCVCKLDIKFTDWLFQLPPLPPTICKCAHQPWSLCQSPCSQWFHTTKQPCSCCWDIDQNHWTCPCLQ